MEKEPTFCPMGCHAWCGRPCKWDPEKGNALLFHADGREKSLEERGLGWNSPPLDPGHVRRSIEDLKGLVIGQHGPSAVTKIPPISVTVTEKALPKSSSVTEKVISRLKVGRPKKEGALSAAEKMKRYRERKRQKPSGA